MSRYVNVFFIDRRAPAWPPGGFRRGTGGWRCGGGGVEPGARPSGRETYKVLVILKANVLLE